MLDSILASGLTLPAFLICTAVSLVLGIATAFLGMYRSKCSQGFAVTVAVLPAIVQIVILLVNGNVGAGVAVAGAFSLVRFRSVPGTAREIGVIFLAMALAGLKLWELIDLAMPMVICLVLQCVVMFLFSYFVIFNVMGRNYDAAVMTAGFIGFAMGATSNAMANMQVVTKKYGPSPVAYFAIPMVGGMFIDFFNAVLIAANIGWWT